MRTLNDLDPDYRDRVVIIPVTFDLGEGKSRISSFIEQRQYPWDPALGHRAMLSQYRVLAQSTAVAVDQNGVITFRKGYGTMSPAGWMDVLEELAES